MRILLLCILLCFTGILQAQNISVYDLSCNHRVNPAGIGAQQPRLSWKISSSLQNTMQAAYQLRVAKLANFSKPAIVWETGKIASGQSVLVPYAGTTLEPQTKYYWQVKVWDGRNNASAWSNTATFETGIFDPAAWKAQWIEPVQDTIKRITAPMVRKEFNASKRISSARAYITSHGLYELYVNGKKAGDQVLTPGWTSYHNRLQYQVYDVTNMLQQGNNAIGAILGDGWYRGSLGWVRSWGVYGKKLGLLAQVVINYSDGTQDIIATDASWKGTQNGPIILNGIYDGEQYDARKEISNWSMPSFNDAGWQPVTLASYSKSNLIATETVPLRKIMEIKPIRIFRTPKGTLVADMGQNMVGWLRIKVRGATGDSVVVRHAEVLDKYGEFYTKNLRAATASIKYFLKGNAEEVYEPRFTFMGFRYAAFDNYPGELKPEDITGIVVHSDMTPAGSFECSDTLINQLQHNIQWGQRGNFLDVPTDCPQRDERLGWTGDAQAFCRTAAFNMNVAPFFTKWMKDITADQLKDGQVPWVIPNVLGNNYNTSAGWGDVSTIAPWTMYQVYGDTQFLENQYPSMKAYVDYIRKKSGDSMIWKGGSVFGDWLFYKPEMNDHTAPDGYTNPDMIATAFFAYSSKLVSQAAAVLGKQQDADFYKDLYEKIKSAFIKNYITPEGRVFSDSQTGYVLALMFGLMPENLQANATQLLVDDIRRRGNHLSTGFLGTPYLCHVLSQHGQTNVAYDLLLQKTFPSWLYPVRMGATTIWERWDGQKTDSTFQDEGMNSFNHYAYGAIGDWMYRVVAGIEIGEAGYKHIIIQPHPDKRLSYAKASYESSYGKIVSGWEIKGDSTVLNVTIPANTSATIILPGTKHEVGSGTYRFSF
jgi:alpha-L-rhamnosidase